MKPFNYWKALFFTFVSQPLYMKQLFLILSTLFISHSLIAQKNFEGTITYRLHSGAGDKPDAELKVLFGNRKLKLMFKEKEEYEKDALVILLDSAAVYTVDFTEKTFKKKMLTLSPPPQKPQKRTISGYSTTPFKPESNGLGSLLGGLMGSASTVFYLADSLSYAIPDVYLGNMEFVMIQNNRIVLGAEIQIKSQPYEPEDSTLKNNTLVTAEAVEIKPMPILETEFFIPADFVDRITMPDAFVSDSVAVVDTTKAAPKAVRRKD
jgi:hypothetical protein